MTGPMNTENILPTSSLPVTTYRKITSQWTITLLHVSSSLGFRQQFYHRWNHVPRQKKKSKELRAFTDWERRSVLHAYHKKKKLMLVCCINKKKSGKKTMIVLSTMHENGKVKKEATTAYNIQLHKRGSWCCWFVVSESFYKDKIYEMTFEYSCLHS